jgi:predicted AlkP superfamily pyrophosphatase or phosphodiesterase
VRRLGQVLSCAVLLALAVGGVVLTAAVAAQTAERPIVVLISIDGWRWDYLAKFAPPTLTSLASRGVLAQGLVPVFPSKTFPNHYTIVTGLYPNRHGIVSNSMRDPALPGMFTLTNVEVQQDTRWWGGIPLWVSIEQQGGVTATMFWPGSDREIAGRRPTFWHPYDRSVSNVERVDRVLTWLKQPEPQRPRFVTLYFDEVDIASHNFAPEAPETRTAALEIDRAIARLVAGLESANLTGRVNLVVLSDHGTAMTTPEQTIYIDDYVDLRDVDVVDWSPIFGATPRAGSSTAFYEALRGKHPALKVFRRENLPPEYRLADHPRFPAVIGIADDGWAVTSHARAARLANEHLGGNHGYDPRYPSMHGLFIAAGPAFREGAEVPLFENVHVYELLCRVLGVRPESNDGDPKVTAPFLR